MSLATFDTYQFENLCGGSHAVHAEMGADGEIHSTGISFNDYRSMSTQVKARPRSGRQLEAPGWAFSNDKLRAVLCRAMEQRAGYRTPLQLPDNARLRVTQEKLTKVDKPRLEAIIDRLCKQFAEAKAAGASQAELTALNQKIQEHDCQLVILPRAAEVITGVIMHFTRGCQDSVETARLLRILPPHVRKIDWQVRKIAGELGFAPRMVIVRRPGTLEKIEQRTRENRERRKAQQFGALLHSGMTWADAKKKMGDSNPHNYHWRALCLKYNVALPVRNPGTFGRVRSSRYQFKHTRWAAYLRKQGWSYPRMAAKFNVTEKFLRRALKRDGLYVHMTCNSLTKINRDEAFKLRAQGWGYKQIAQHFGTSYNAAWAILHYQPHPRKARRH